MEPLKPTGVTRARERRRPRGPAEATAQAAILDAAEKLLETTSLRELSVGQVIEAAGVSRTSFYYYFSGKDAVVVALFHRAYRDIRSAVGALSPPDTDPVGAIDAALRRWLVPATQHAAVFAAASEAWPHSPEVERLWRELLAQAVESFTTLIERERALGAAPPGPDAETLATALVYSQERIFQVAQMGVPGLPDLESAVEPLVQLYAGAIYGGAATG